MQRIDAHQHFWKFDHVRDSWITDDMSVIQRDFYPADLEPLLLKNGLDGCVVVQSDQSEAENTFQLAFADMYGFIKGVVGWVDLQAANIDEKLQHYSQFNKLKGFRHVLQAEEDDRFMLRPSFMRGIAALGQHGFSYDILIFPHHLVYAKQLVAAFPDQRFVIDHIAKPYIREKKIDEWQKNMSLIAGHENVYCKVSGMVTEANWNTWKNEDFRPYLDTVFEAFGPKRVMFGSDWPVCLVAARYEQVIGIMKDYLSGFSPDEQSAFWGGNAFRFYQLK
jgi:L-fuconolactonase